MPVASLISSCELTRAPTPVHVLAQPAEETAELPCRDLLVEGRQVGAQALVQLRRDECAQRVRRIIAERADRPVHVLQAAFGIVGGLETEPLLQTLVPGGRQVADRERAVENPLLELVAQHDVHRIRELVGVHAHGAAPHAGERAVQVARLPLRPAHAELLFEQRVQPREERPAAPDHHLEQQ